MVRSATTSPPGSDPALIGSEFRVVYSISSVTGPVMRYGLIVSILRAASAAFSRIRSRVAAAENVMHV